MRRTREPPFATRGAMRPSWRVPRSPSRVRGSPDAGHAAAATLRETRASRLRQARGPRAHGFAQDQQRHRPDTAHETNGQDRVIAETGAGQHGVATATAAARLGLGCTVFMGEVDTKRQELNVFRMELLGATVVPVTSGSKTLKDAVNEAMREWVTCVADTHYCLGSVMGPHPFPWMVREFQRIIGTEAARQLESSASSMPDVVVACVGGGSNAAGRVRGFRQLTGAARSASRPPAGAAVHSGSPGVLHGMRSLISRTSSDRSKRRTRSRRVSTIPGSVPSTPIWPRRVAPSTSPIGDEDVIGALRC